MPQLPLQTEYIQRRFSLDYRFYVDYEFRDQAGTIRQGSMRAFQVSHWPPQKGKAVRIFYDPANPSHSVAEEFGAAELNHQNTSV